MAIPHGTPPPSGGPTGQQPALPWERTASPIRSPGAAAPLTDIANAHALQVIKGRIHRRLLERLNLSNLDRLDRQQVAEAVRKVVHDLITNESLPLNFEERDLVV